MASAPSSDMVVPRYGSVAITPTGWPSSRARKVPVEPPYSVPEHRSAVEDRLKDRPDPVGLAGVARNGPDHRFLPPPCRILACDDRRRLVDPGREVGQEI